MFTGFASVAPVKIETFTGELFTSEICQHIVRQSSASCVGRRCHRRRSIVHLRGSGPVLVSSVPHRETQALVLHCLVPDLGDHWGCRCFCTIRLVRTCHPHYCSLLSTRSCWLHSCILSATFLTASSFAFLASLSLRPCPGCADYWCASCAPPDRLLLDLLVHLRVSRSSVLSGALCCFRQRHIPHTLVCGEPPRVSWSEHPSERYDSRDRSLWLFAAHVSSTMACLML